MMHNSPADPAALGDPVLIDGCRAEPDTLVLAAWPGDDIGTWRVADEVGAGIGFDIPVGTLRPEQTLWADLLLDGTDLAVFEFTFHQGDGAVFRLMFGALAQCQARIRFPLSVTDFGQWRLERDAAWLKPICWGQAVDPRLVERIELRMMRHNGEPVRWCMTPIRVGEASPPALDHPLLPRGPLLDELGQSTLHDWPTRSSGVEEVRERLRAQREEADDAAWPDGFSRWGGWEAGGRIAEGTGFFGTHHDGRRWWLVDPDGYPFWSSGVDCLGPVVDMPVAGLTDALTAPAVDPARPGDYLVSNLVRGFGAENWKAEWAATVVGMLKRYGYNSIGNWSDLDTARGSGVGYVRPMALDCRRTPMIYRDFPDVFAPSFVDDAADYAQPLADTRDDPGLLGYFLMNEPTWGFAEETPAAGMLRTSGPCASRAAFRDFLRGRYETDADLAAAWGDGLTVDGVAEGRWAGLFTDPAIGDLEAFSTVLVARLFDELSAAARRVDPNHLNLGARYYTIPPSWALAGMTSFDVFSINCYRDRVPTERLQELSTQTGCPVVIGEWHFGALDAGLPASGIGRVPTQADRGKAVRRYIEYAAAQPWCVGVHYFTWYDQSALGRFDGENYNIGLVDICHRPYEHVVDAARKAHEHLYGVAAGHQPPFDDAPQYLPMLFI